MVEIPKTTPEQIFMESQSNIDTATVANCILTRTKAIIELIHSELTNSGFSASQRTLVAALWQVSGNLDELKKIVEYWYKSERIPAD